MSERDPALDPFDAVVGTWNTEATHPLFDEVVPGRTAIEWLEGGRFLVLRSHNDHDMFPDAIWVIGAPESGGGLAAEYFDSRGLRRTYGASLEGGVLRFWREGVEFDQRFSATLGRDEFEGHWQMAETRGDWREDLKVTYRRVRARSLHLFAGLRVRDFQGTRPWYERLLGEPSFFPHATEAVWTLADDRSLYVVEHADGAGKGVVTVFADDLDAQVDAIAARGLEPDERDTLSGGVRRARYHDPDGNEVVFGGPPLDTGS
jgi:hypothetical protein